MILCCCKAVVGGSWDFDVFCDPKNQLILPRMHENEKKTSEVFGLYLVRHFDFELIIMHDIMSKTAGLGSWAPHIPEVSAIYAEKAGNANKNLAIYYYTLSVFHA